MMSLPYSRKTYFDGVAFEDMGIVVERVHDDLPEARDTLAPYTNQRGSRFDMSTLGPREIRLECRAYEDEWQDFEELKERLYPILYTGDERKLQLRNHPDQYYMAHYSSFTEGDRIGATGVGAFELTFVASDPARYGQERVYVYKGTNQQHFDIGGTADATDMKITLRGTYAGSSPSTVKLEINDSYLEFPESVIDRFYDGRIDVYVNSRVVQVGLTKAGTTVRSTWPSLKPGRWNVRLSKGSCSSIQFEWTQRYL